MNDSLTEQEIQELNRNHQHHIEVYAEGNPYKLGAVIYSKLTEATNSTLFLDVYINKDWSMDEEETAKLFFDDWLNKHPNLSECEYYNITIYQFKALGFVMQKTDDLAVVIEQVLANYAPSDGEGILQGIYSNKVAEKSSLLSRFLDKVGVALGFVLAGVLNFAFYGFPLVGLFVLNHVAFVDVQDFSLDIGILIIKSFFIKFLIVVVDVLVVGYLFTYAKDKVTELVARSKEKRQKKII